MNDKIKVVGRVYETTDYTVFKQLIGNRTDVKSRATKIKESIKNIGLRNNPIIVNRFMQVVDGQGRLEACRQLNLPVRFVIDEDADIEVCKWMNIGQSNWKAMDYVQCYAENGNENYVWLLKLIDRHPDISVTEILSIHTNVIATGGGSLLGVIKSGKLIFTEDDFDEGDAIITKVETVMPYIKRIEGYQRITTTALAFCLRVKGVDANRLLSVFRTKYHLFVPSASIVPTLTCISDLYNKGLKKGRLYFDALYKETHTEAIRWG